MRLITMPLTRKDYEIRQRDLEALYHKLWPELTAKLDILQASREISKPFLIDLTAHNYPEAQTKLVVVGQQTNDWRAESASEGDSVGDLLGVYKDFCLGKRYMTTFFQAVHQLYKCLNPSGPENGFIWTNLFRVDEKNRRPERDLEDILLRLFNVLPKEIELAEPDMVVFFTGPNYDDFLKATFPGVSLTPVKPIEPERVLSRVNLQVGDVCPQAFRVYHPNGLRRHKKWPLISEICKLYGPIPKPPSRSSNSVILNGMKEALKPDRDVDGRDEDCP
jgi:hypothetical protein